MSLRVSSSAKARTCGGVPSGHSKSVCSAAVRTMPAKPGASSSRHETRHRVTTSRTFSRCSSIQCRSISSPVLLRSVPPKPMAVDTSDDRQITSRTPDSETATSAFFRQYRRSALTGISQSSTHHEGDPMKAILTKVSASGRRYFHTGRNHQIEVYGGGTALVAETGFLPGDAHQFASLAEAQAEADWLKGRGIGGADWTAEEVRP